ncbi:hypothetical protein SLS60_009101 [Paraconiothyrium brasiliense]|uniref:1-alkyl-2-acetylglycerophosphocholine esterase n=1 Tax=Paraconiothyrium brasiliense TaxID=300254 RepID=A0ABR3QWB4_9PLEO
MWVGLATYYEEYYNLSSGAFGNTTARILDAPPTTDCDDLALPTLLWGPPFTGPPSQMFSSLFSDLVSKGYSIVTVDHPGEQPYLQYPNGIGVKGLGKDFVPTGEFINRVHEYRLEDNFAVLDALPSLREELGAFFDMVGRMTGEGVLSGNEQVKKEWPEVEFSSSAPSSVA